MNVSVAVRSIHDPGIVRRFLADCEQLSAWVPFVALAEPGDGCCTVVLAGELGPMRRTKRLRFLVTTSELGVRFDRAEVDGRRHAPWHASFRVDAAADGSVVTGDLRYGGALADAVARRVLDAAVERACRGFDAAVDAWLAIHAEPAGYDR